MAHGTHVTATAHSGSTAAHSDVHTTEVQLADAAPASSDQAPKRAQGAAAAADAAAGSDEAVMAAKGVSHSSQVVTRHHIPHQDLRHLMASAHNRSYTGEIFKQRMFVLARVKWGVRVEG